MNLLPWLNFYKQPKNRFFIWLLPLNFILMKYLIWYAMPLYLVGWIFLQTRLLTHVHLIIRAFIYGILIAGALYVEKDFTKAEFWVSLLFYLIPLIEWHDDEKVSNLLLTPIIFLVASVFIFKPDFFIMLFMIIWLIFFLFIYIELYCQQALNLFTIRWGYLIKISSIISVLSLIVFIALPRFSFGIIPSFNQAKDSLLSLNDQIDLDTLGPIQKNDAVSMRILVEGGTPQKDLYWKIYVLSDNDAISWKRDVNAKEIMQQQNKISGDTLRYKVLSDGSDIKAIPSIGMPIVTSDIKGMLMVNENGEITLRDKTKPLRDIFITTSLETSDISPYKEKIAIQMAPELQVWAKKLRASSDSDENFVKAFISHLQKDFRYTLDTKAFQYNGLDQFFFNEKKGYCSHFAMAMATALRANQIPANVVMGFYHGEWNEVGGYYILRNSDAHAWVEAKLDHGPWQRIDPTKFIQSLPNEINRPMQTQQMVDGRRYKWEFLRTILHRIDYFDAQVTGSILSYGYDQQDAAIINIKRWKNLKSVGFMISVMAIVLIVMLFSIYLLKMNHASFNAIQIIERNWIHFLEKHFAKRLTHESLNQFTSRLNKKRLAMTLKKDMQIISDAITQYKFGPSNKDKKYLLALKKIIQDFNQRYSKYISINKVR